MVTIVPNAIMSPVAMFANLNDFHALFIDGATGSGGTAIVHGQNAFSSLFGVQNICQRTGYGALPKYETLSDFENKTTMKDMFLKRVQGLNWKDQRGAPFNFRQLDPELRGCNHWLSSNADIVVMDMRWIFHTVDAAKDYFRNEITKSDEMQTVKTYNTSFVKNIATKMNTIQSKDDCKIDLGLNSKKIALVINTGGGNSEHRLNDAIALRRATLMNKVPYCTNMSTAQACLMGIRSLKNKKITVISLQDI